MSNSGRCDQDQGYKNGISTGPSQGREAAGAGQHLGGRWGATSGLSGKVLPSTSLCLHSTLTSMPETLDATDKPFYFPF